MNFPKDRWRGRRRIIFPLGFNAREFYLHRTFVCFQVTFFSRYCSWLMMRRMTGKEMIDVFYVFIGTCESFFCASYIHDCRQVFIDLARKHAKNSSVTSQIRSYKVDFGGDAKSVTREIFTLSNRCLPGVTPNKWSTLNTWRLHGKWEAK